MERPLGGPSPSLTSLAITVRAWGGPLHREGWNGGQESGRAPGRQVGTCSSYVHGVRAACPGAHTEWGLSVCWAALGSWLPAFGLSATRLELEALVPLGKVSLDWLTVLTQLCGRPRALLATLPGPQPLSLVDRVPAVVGQGSPQAHHSRLEIGTGPAPHHQPLPGLQWPAWWRGRGCCRGQALRPHIRSIGPGAGQVDPRTPPR